MSAEMEAVLKKVRARQALTDAERQMARSGLLAHSRRVVATASDAKPRGDGINRKAMWAKAMKQGRRDDAAPDAPAAASLKATTGKSVRKMSQGEINDVWAKAMKRQR